MFQRVKSKQMTRTKILFKSLRKSDKKNLLKLQLLIFFLAISEAFTLIVLSETIKFFLGDDNYIFTVLAVIFGDVSSYKTNGFTIAIATTMCVFFTSLFATYSTWSIAKYSTNLGAYFANKLYFKLTLANYEKFIDLKQSDITRTLTLEIRRVTQGIFLPVLNIISKVILSISFVLLITFQLSVWFLIIFTIIMAFYFIIFVILKNLVNRNGEIISHSSERRVLLINEYFSAFKFMKVRNSFDFLTKRFFTESSLLESANARNITLAQIPRYFIETILICLIIFGLYNITSNGSESIRVLLPDLTILALLTLKLAGSLQQVYYNASLLAANHSAFKIFTELLLNLDEEQSNTENKNYLMPDVIDFTNITYKYPESEKNILNNFHFKIEKGQKIAIVGPSGCGKSTLGLIIAGLINPKGMSLYFDGKKQSAGAMGKLRNEMAYFPQESHIAEATIWANVSLELAKKNVDMSRLNAAIEVSKLRDYISSLPEDIDRNIKFGSLSGGQRQRVSLARVFYLKPSIIIFDEATSALDENTTHYILDHILKDNFTTVVYITHDKSSLKKFDKVVRLA